MKFSSIVAGLFLGAASAARLTLLGDPADQIPGEYIVRFANKNAYNRHKNANQIPSLSFVNDNMNVYIASGALSPAEVSTVEEWNGVLDFHTDIVINGDAGTQPNPPTWGLDRIDARSLPLDESYSWQEDGSGVTIFVLDSGIETTHPDWNAGQAKFLADCLSTCQFTNNTFDQDGHGTHVSGTAASPTYGVAKGAKVLNVRVLNQFGSGTIAGVIRGIVTAMEYAAARPNRRFVINMSLGASVVIDSVNDAATDAVLANIPVVVSAGNSAADACFATPAGADGVVTVASSTINDRSSSFTNFGPCVEIYAPGSSIRSLNAFYRNGPASIVFSGTSMSSPTVAGAVATLLQRDSSLTPDEITEILTESGTKDALTNVPTSDTPNVLLYSPLEVSTGPDEWLGNPNVPKSDLNPMPTIDLSKRYGFSFTLKSKRIAITHVGMYVARAGCDFFTVQFWDLQKKKQKGPSIDLPLAKVGELSSVQLENPIVIPKKGRKYAMTVRDRLGRNCQNDALYDARRNPQDLRFDANTGRDWDRNDTFVDIQDTGYCRGANGNPCSNFQANGSPHNYMLLFGYTAL